MMEMPVVLLPLPDRYLERMPQALATSERNAIRLLRRWVASRSSGVEPLPDLVGFAEASGVASTAAVAAASLFQLTEACLGRDLDAACCCSPQLGRDERAVLALLRAAPDVDAVLSSQAVPHGLPSVLRWSALSLRRLLGDDGWGSVANSASDARTCPFGPAPAEPAAA
jgi:hypothetical protein